VKRFSGKNCGENKRLEHCARVYLGKKCSKDKIDACKLPKQEFCQFDNDARGHKKLIRWIGTHVKRILFEPTGSYSERMLEP